MNWTPEANAKVRSFHTLFWTPTTNQTQLFLGVLDQLKDKNVKLDNERLAAYMGPGRLPFQNVSRVACV